VDGIKTRSRLASAIFVGTIYCLTNTIVMSTATQAQDWIEDTFLIDIRLGSDLSDSARAYGKGGYELSDGTPVQFGDWYSSDWRDLSVTFLTEVNRNFGILWGLSTGEAGEKYTIDPGFRIGLIVQTELSRNSMLSFSASTILGGYLREKTCIADYGSIGGVQKVNCRLAATPLPPKDTLDYLFEESPADQVQLRIDYAFNF
jgi:hypothetical protein